MKIFKKKLDKMNRSQLRYICMRVFEQIDFTKLKTEKDMVNFLLKPLENKYKIESTPPAESLPYIFLTKYPQCNTNTMEVKQDGDRIITVARTVKVSGQHVKMNLCFRSNRWGERKEFAFLEPTDFYLDGLYNGTKKQRVEGINSGTGNFTKFIYDVVADGSLYVRGASPYWRQKFDVVSMHNSIIKVTKKPPRRMGMVV